MKNMKKLVALFAATVMAMSVSVSAFAATVETTVRNDGADITDNSFNLVFEAPTGGEADIDQLTMIAYLVPAATTLETWVAYDGTQEIVAINQVDGDDEFGSVPVDVTKLTAGNSIAVAIGGTDVAAADIYKALITYSTAPQVVAYEITYKLDGGVAEGNPAESNSEETIAEFFARVETAPEKDGYTFLYWSKTADGEAINTALEDKMSTLLDDPAGTTVTLYAVYEAEEANSISITFKWGDVNLSGAADGVDYSAALKANFGTVTKFTTTQGDVTYTFTWNSNDVTGSDGKTYTYVGPKWGDVNVSGAADGVDYSAALKANFGTVTSFTSGDKTYQWNKDVTIELTEKN